MNILALDLGTKCGWAVSANGGKSASSGTQNLKPTTHESSGMRYLKFKKFLYETVSAYAVDHVVYEEVHAHAGVEAAHVYGALMGTLQLLCHEMNIEYSGVGVGTIKKHAHGKGNATKEQMILAAQRLYPSVNIVDDNHADALCLLHYAKNNLIE